MNFPIICQGSFFLKNIVCFSFRFLEHTVSNSPANREMPLLQLLRKTFLIAEAENIEDYCTQLMSMFGRVLKYDSNKKVRFVCMST